MLDIGWTELLVIAVILIVVVGPKDLPPMIRAFGKMTSRLRRTAGEFRAQFDEALREAELDDLRKSVDEVRSLNPKNALRDAINPLRQMGDEIKSDLKKATTADAKAAAGIAPSEPPVEPAPLPEMPSPLTGVPNEFAQPMADPAPAPAPEPVKVAAPRQSPGKSTAPAPSAGSAGAKPAKSVAASTPVKASRAKPATVETAAAKPTTPKKPRKPKNEEPA
ncbi:MAG: Sec-independent protein translocase protein TatB [Rhizobium sp.]|nr:Sec-independent protein translocase protein TatB [Rhizobium sp.]